jgi:hypothetical protein
MVAQIVSRWTQEAACVNSTGRPAAYTHLLSTSSSSSSVPTCTLCVPGMQMKSLDAVRVKASGWNLVVTEQNLLQFSKYSRQSTTSFFNFYIINFFIVYHLHTFQPERILSGGSTLCYESTSGIAWNSYCSFSECCLCFVVLVFTELVW